MKRLVAWVFPAVCCVMVLAAGGVWAQEKKNVPANGNGKELTLVEAYTCEEMSGSTPKNRAIVFSSGLKKVYCYTAFDHVPGEMVIYHEWYRRDKLKAKVGLGLKPPRWSTFSSMRIRKSDQGPWRVTVTGSAGKVLGTVRFSVTE